LKLGISPAGGDVSRRAWGAQVGVRTLDDLAEEAARERPVRALR
jgi:hypothetical protein